MRRFEARFHPTQGQQDDYVVVGYVVWDPNRRDGVPRVEPPQTCRARISPHVMFSTLRHLVRVTGARAHERLTALPSRHWSFVDITAQPSGEPV
jgi:hypothetical protein